MTWRNPQLPQAAEQWRMAQGAVIRTQRRIRVLDEESSSPVPKASRAGDLALLVAQANKALSECLRLNRQADKPSGK